MRKLIIGVVIVSAIILGVVGFQQLLTFGKNLFTVVSYQQHASQQEFDSVKFKSVNENTSLLPSVLAVNESFLKTPPLKKTTTKKLEKAYELLDFFPNNQTYHTAKRKIEKAVFTELPILHSRIAGLSDKELDSFFSANTLYLDKNFGITDIDDFRLLAFSLSSMKSGNIVGCSVVSDSVLFNSFDNSSLFNIVIETEDKKKMQLGVTARLESSSPNQNSPEVQIIGSYGEVTE